MKFIHLTSFDHEYKLQASKILQENFDCYKNAEIAQIEIEEMLQEKKICIGAVEDECIVGVIGGIPTYNGNVYELHPLAVKKSHQRKGIGSKLIALFEEEVAERGAITIYLGSDDEKNQTSLSNKDLYPNLYNEIKHIQNIKNHPYSFYQKNGYKIVGVIPDANGFGKPDIYMAKRVGDINV